MVGTTILARMSNLPYSLTKSRVRAGMARKPDNSPGNAPDTVIAMPLLARMSNLLFPFVRPLLHFGDAEAARDRAISIISCLPYARKVMTSPVVATRLAGIDFPNPVGLAPGLDKDARVAHATAHFGFGFGEVGTLTPLSQEGNLKPRLFWLDEDRAIINRMGFNNEGQEAAKCRIEALRRGRLAGPLGLNIGANKSSAGHEARIADYVAGFGALASLADYVTINVSSPNTPGLRGLQDCGALDALLDAVMSKRASMKSAVPLFLKLAPDLLPGAAIDAIVGVAMDKKIDALIIGNTTLERPLSLRSRYAGESGGLSGAPLRDLAQQRLIDFRAASGGQLPLIAVGGIASADDAWDRICAGASLVQFYSAIAYSGFGLAATIVSGLEARARCEGFDTIAQAVGSAQPVGVV